MTQGGSDSAEKAPPRLDPTSVRIELVRDEGRPTGEGLLYRGFADVGARIAVEVRADLEGARAHLEESEAVIERGLAAQLEKLIAALVRAATRAELEQGRAPPRKIVRWRALS